MLNNFFNRNLNDRIGVHGHEKLVGKEKREAEALKLFHEEQNKKQAQELLEQYLAYKKVAVYVLYLDGCLKVHWLQLLMVYVSF